jgi:hypothetical protein
MAVKAGLAMSSLLIAYGSPQWNPKPPARPPNRIPGGFFAQSSFPE